MEGGAFFTTLFSPLHPGVMYGYYRRNRRRIYEDAVNRHLRITGDEILAERRRSRPGEKNEAEAYPSGIGHGGAVIHFSSIRRDSVTF